MKEFLIILVTAAAFAIFIVFIFPSLLLLAL